MRFGHDHAAFQARAGHDVHLGLGRARLVNKNPLNLRAVDHGGEPGQKRKATEGQSNEHG
jgi:hypothetical protein